MVLCLLLAARVAAVAYAGTEAQVPFTVALFVLPLLCAVPASWRLLVRYRWQALAVQAVLTWVPLVVFGGSWQVGIGGLLAGLVLLTMRGPASWVAAAGVLAAEATARATLTGLPSGSTWFAVLSAVTLSLGDAAAFFGVVRLAQIVGELEEAQNKAAGQAVAAERLQAARSLQPTVAKRLAGIAARTAAAQQALSRDSAWARAQIKSAGADARVAVAQARALTLDHHRPLPEPALPGASRAVIGARLTWAVLVVTLSSFGADSLGAVIESNYGPPLKAIAMAGIVLTAALQLHHWRAARKGRRPWAWPMTLAMQATLVYAFVFPFVAAYVGGFGGFLAGSFLVLVPGRWRWAGFGAVVASWPVLYTTLRLQGMAVAAGQRLLYPLYFATFAAAIGLLVYGLTWLVGLAAQVEALGGQLARMAVVQERLRIARDVHDLLGLGLSAIALKADLIAHLIGRDDARSAAELKEMSRICAAARADIRLVTAADRRLSLTAELTAARKILASATIAVRATTTAEPLPECADEVLTPVLREAVTNVLRHSTARTCTIKTTAADGILRLQVTNDGAPGTPPAQPARRGHAGQGLTNLTARLQAVGGTLTSGQTDSHFDLIAQIPVAPSPLWYRSFWRKTETRRPLRRLPIRQYAQQSPTQLLPIVATRGGQPSVDDGQGPGIVAPDRHGTPVSAPATPTRSGSAATCSPPLPKT